MQTRDYSTTLITWYIKNIDIAKPTPLIDRSTTITPNSVVTTYYDNHVCFVRVLRVYSTQIKVLFF